MSWPPMTSRRGEGRRAQRRTILRLPGASLLPSLRVLRSSSALRIVGAAPLLPYLVVCPWTETLARHGRGLCLCVAAEEALAEPGAERDGLLRARCAVPRPTSLASTVAHHAAHPFLGTPCWYAPLAHSTAGSCEIGKPSRGWPRSRCPDGLRLQGRWPGQAGLARQPSVTLGRAGRNFMA